MTAPMLGKVKIIDTNRHNIIINHSAWSKKDNSCGFLVTSCKLLAAQPTREHMLYHQKIILQEKKPQLASSEDNILFDSGGEPIFTV